MKNKLLFITAMLAVIVAMTGIAAASIVMGTPDALDGINELTYKIQSVSVTTAGSESIDDFAITKVTKLGTGVVNANDYFLIQIDGINYVPPSQVTTNYGSGHTYPVGFKLVDSVINNPNLKGSFFVEYTAHGVSGNAYLTTTGVNPVPEFPTVALPIAAVIGLVFFFQQKKRKEE